MIFFIWKVYTGIYIKINYDVTLFHSLFFGPKIILVTVLYAFLHVDLCMHCSANNPLTPLS
jgi:hypothetical protein